MVFYDIVTEMGYSVFNMDNMIEITKKDIYPQHESLVDTKILFKTDEKKILGYLVPLRNMFDEDDMCHVYKIYLDMKRDLKFFAEKSKYDII